MSILFRMARAAAFMFLMLSLITGMTGRAGAEEQEVKHVLANGLNIAYTEQGEGPAIVLIHGGGLTSAMWAKQIPALAKKIPGHHSRYARTRKNGQSFPQIRIQPAGR